MRIKLLILAALFPFFGTSSVSAIDTPILINPPNNSNISSIPTFNWQSVSGSKEYNILIDDEPTVTSPYTKTPYYPTNQNYSPQTLNPGTYYWKVKAKDSSGVWSDWSTIWSFTLTNSTPNPSPSPTPTHSPTPFPTPSSTSPPAPKANTSSKTPVSSLNPTNIPSPTSIVKTPLPTNTSTRTDYKTAIVAGVSSSATQSATPTAKTEVKNQKLFNPYLIIGIGLIFAGLSSLGYIYLKKKL